MSNKQKLAGILFSVVVFATMLAGAHPLVDHFGETASSGIGTFGSKWVHTDTSGTRYGLWGESKSTSGRALYGRATSSSGQTLGVLGRTDSTSDGTSGVYGLHARNFGSGRGVTGASQAPNGLGVYGYNYNTGGSGIGVGGVNLATSGAGIAIWGANESPDGWAGVFSSPSGHGVHIAAATGKTGLIVSGGSKSAVVRTSDGDRLLYNEESTEVWFTDYGFGKLAGGRAIIKIDPIFAETVNIAEGYHVFVQSYGDAELFVSSRAPSEFEVLASSLSKDQDAEFSYRIVAKRLGFEENRLSFAPWVSEGEPYYVPREVPPIFIPDD